ncbi:diacylglycerol kinase family lipid kinase [soil metagenome]
MNGRKKTRIAVILNEGAGTLKGSNSRQVAGLIETALKDAGHEVTLFLGRGREIGQAIDGHLKSGDVDQIIVGGGDGTVSTSAAQIRGSDIALGVIPLGTMNLFARALGIPLDIKQAVAVLAEADTRLVDAAEADGKMFLHQLSFGLQPKLIKLRQKMRYGSRIGKIMANFKAFSLAMKKPPVVRLSVKCGSETIELATPALVISNNLYGKKMLPMPDRLDEGVLGVYILTTARWSDFASITASAMTGDWTANPAIDARQAETVTIQRSSRSSKPLVASLDGELISLSGKIVVKILPKALKVLVPREAKNP